MKKLRIPSLKRLTKRLEIRPLQMRDDRAWMASHCAMLPPKTPWEISRIPISQLDFSEFIKILNKQRSESENNQKHTLGIFHKEIGTLLGYIFIQDIVRGEKVSAILDFRLINIYWGNGFAQEAVNEALKLKTALKINSIKINPRSFSKLKL